MIYEMILERRTSKLTCFKRLGGGYDNVKSIFDDIKADDIVFAFFPCVRFCHQIRLAFQGNNAGYKDWDMIKKLENDRKLFKELAEYYDLVTKLAIICLRRNIKLVIENPKSSTHILTDYWALKPSIIDYDRSRDGDYYKKPTQYWFVNFKPVNNFIFGSTNYHNRKIDGISYQSTVERSMIHSDYANKFIRQYILKGE